MLVPTRDGAEFLADTVGSALEQTHRDLRVIVSVEPSTDDTVRVARTLAATDRRVEVLEGQHPVGWVANCNRLLDAVTEDEFMILPHDDLLDPNCVARLADTLATSRSAVCAYSDLAGFGSRSLLISAPPIGSARLERVVAFIGGWPNGLAFRALTRRRLARGLRLRDGSFDAFHADTTYVMELLARGPAVHVPEVLYRKRYRPESVHDVWSQIPVEVAAEAWLGHTLDTMRAAASLRLGVRGKRLVLGACLDRFVRTLGLDRDPLPGSEEVLREAVSFARALVRPPASRRWATARLDLAEGVAARAAGESTRARAALERAVEAAPECSEARVLLGALLVEAGHRELGLAEVDAAVVGQPWNPTVRLHAAWVRSGAGDLIGAVGEAERAVFLVPHVAAAHVAYSVMLELSGDHASAISAARQAMMVDPGNPSGGERLAALTPRSDRTASPD